MFKEKIRCQILNGCLQDYKAYLSGMYKGFFITLENFQEQFQYIVKINITAANEADMKTLSDFLENQKQNQKKLLEAGIESHAILLTIKMPSLGKNIPETINSIVDPIIDYLNSYSFTSGCSECGTTMDTINCYEINYRPYFICDTCKNQIHTTLQTNEKEVQAKKSHLLSGLVGAFLGSLIGAIIWILIYKLGYIAGIAGVITGVCAMKGYTLLGGHLDKKGVIGSVIIMLITIFFANKIAWSWDAYSALSEYGWTFTDVYKELGYILEETDLVGSYYGELVIGYVLTIVGSGKSIINAFRASTGSYNIKKVN